MARGNIKKNYILNVINQLSNILAPLITTPYISRVLGVEGVGEYSFAESLASYFVLAAILGTEIYAQREISYVQDDKIERSRVFFETILLRCLTTLMAAALYLGAVTFSGSGRIMMLILSVNIISVACDITWFFRGMEDFWKIVRRNLCFRLLNIIYIFLCVKTEDDLLKYAFGMVGLNLLSHLSMWCHISKYVIRVDRNKIKPLRNIRVIFSLFIPTIAIQIYTIFDKTMLGLFTETAVENGYYEQSMKIVRALQVIVTSLGAVMAPRIGYYFSRGENEKVVGYMHKAYRFMWAIGTPLALGSIGISGNLVPWYLGPGFGKAETLLRILPFLAVIIGMSNVTGIQYLIPTKRQNLLTKTVVTGAAVNFCLNLMLIPKLYSVGAALASVAAELVITVMQFHYVRDEIDVKRIILSGKNYLISGVIMLACLELAAVHMNPSIMHTVILTAGGALIYAVGLWGMRDELFFECVKIFQNKMIGLKPYMGMTEEVMGKNIEKNIERENTNEPEVGMDKLKLFQEYYILFLIFIISFTNQLGLTTFYCNPWRAVYKPIFVLTALVILSKIPFVYKKKEFWFSIPAAAVFYLAFSLENYKYQVFLAPLIIGCIGINVRKIFYAAFVPSALVIVIMMLSSFSGGIENIVYWSRNIRSSWGNVYPTDFGTAVLMIVAFLWILFKNLPDEVFLLPAMFSFYISHTITRSITSEYLTFLFMIMLLLRGFGKRVLEKKKGFTWFYKIYDFLMLLVFPALGLLMIAGVYAYFKEVPLAKTLDVIFHSRFVHPAKMYAEYGLKPFGTYFEMIGNGGSSLANYGEYNFLDCTYAQILIRNGWVTYIVANVLWVYTTLKALRSGNRRVAYAMTLLAFDCVMEHHWFEINYDVFVILPFADFVNCEKWEENLPWVKAFKKKWENRKYAVVFTTAVCLLAFAAWKVLPVIFSWNRTIISGFGLYGGGWRGVVVFLFISVLCAVALLFICCISDSAAKKCSGIKSGKSQRLLLGTAVITAACTTTICNLLVQKIVNRNSERIESERDVLELIAESAKGKVYAGKLPEAYIRKIKGISYSYFSGDDYGRYEDATIIADASWDSRCLTGKGFLYLGISDEDAIYTNDSGTVQALKDAGYILKGYNDYENEVDLDQIAKLNGLEISVDEDIEGIVLNSAEQEIKDGPSVDLNYGKFTAKFGMTLKSETSDPNKRVCSIYITSYEGEKEITKKDVFVSDFNENGECIYEVPFSGGGQDYDFKIVSAEDISCILTAISYRRTPDMDTHIQVDGEGRTIHEEYYDLDGTPKQMSEGHFGMEYAYDDRDLPIMRRYLGSDLKPMLINSGFAEAHRVYDENKLMVKESYYGVDGEAVNLPKGQHEVVKDYDFAGNVIQEAYFDIDGKSVMYDGSYAKINRRFDENKSCIHEEYYNTEGQPAALKSGFAGLDREYDEDGNVTRILYLGTDMKPVVIDKGYAEMRREYNHDKCVISESYYGAQGENILLNDKFFMVKRVFNDKKQCVKEMYYGTDEKPILLNGGYAGYEQQLDDRGSVIWRAHLGLDGNPVMTDWGYSIWHRNYNEKKQVIREEYYDVEDEKITRPDGQFAVEHEFDEVGNCISDMYYGLDNQRILVNGAFWKVVRTYDGNKKNVHEEYYGTGGNLILVSGKYAMIDFVYDDSGKLVKKILMNESGEVVEEQDVK